MVLGKKLEHLRALFFKKLPWMRQECDDFINWATVQLLEGRDMRTNNYWILYDYLREINNWDKKNKKENRIEAYNQSDILHKYADENWSNSFEEVENKIYIEQIKKYLTPTEYKYIYEMVVNGMTMTDVAEKYDVTISAIYSVLKYARKELKTFRVDVKF